MITENRLLCEQKRYPPFNVVIVYYCLGHDFAATIITVKIMEKSCFFHRLNGKALKLNRKKKNKNTFYVRTTAFRYWAIDGIMGFDNYFLCTCKRVTV